MKNGCSNQASKQLKPKWPDGKDGENDGER